jgi:hypothetical protein
LNRFVFVSFTYDIFKQKGKCIEVLDCDFLLVGSEDNDADGDVVRDPLDDGRHVQVGAASNDGVVDLKFVFIHPKSNKFFSKMKILGKHSKTTTYMKDFIVFTTLILILNNI